MCKVEGIDVRQLDKSELPLFVALQMGIAMTEAMRFSHDPLLDQCWVLGAWLGESLIGALQFARSVELDTAIGMDAVVSRPMQNHGIGSLLYREREKFLLEKEITKTVTGISLWGGASLNFALNKNGARGIRYLRNCYIKNEDRLWVEKDLRIPRECVAENELGNVFKNRIDSDYKFFPITSKRNFVRSHARRNMELLINHGGYEAVSVVRPEYSGEKYNLLVLSLSQKGGETHVSS